jgi:hypothetical protein
MIQALHELFSEFLEAIWTGAKYGVAISVALTVAFLTLKYVSIFHKAAKLLGAE